MPQLDKVSFLSQFFWLCLFFFSFYIASLKYFIPEMSRILKYRKKRLNISQQGVTSMNQEKSQISSSADSVLENALKSGKSSFKDVLQATENWLSNLVLQTNRTKLLHTNSSYLSSVGETSLSQSISVQPVFSNFSSTIFLHAFLRKINPALLNQVNNLDFKSSFTSKDTDHKKQSSEGENIFKKVKKLASKKQASHNTAQKGDAFKKKKRERTERNAKK